MDLIQNFSRQIIQYIYDSSLTLCNWHHLASQSSIVGKISLDDLRINVTVILLQCSSCSSCLFSINDRYCCTITLTYAVALTVNLVNCKRLIHAFCEHCRISNKSTALIFFSSSPQQPNSLHPKV